MNYLNDVTELIGNTPLIKINKFSQNATILAKVEFLNPSHSIKDRPALNMLKEAFASGVLTKQSVIIEPTSGNTGVALAMLGAHYGIKTILTMPSSMSIERQNLLKAFGATLVLTDPKLGMKGAVDEALNLAAKTPNSFIPSQFENSANPDSHAKTTAKEIWEQTGGKVDIVVAGFGTGGTISGVGKTLKALNPDIKIIGVEPLASPLITQGTASSHKIQGIGANFIPKNLDQNIIDEFITVSNEDALKFGKQLATTEGLLAGISSGANIYAADKIANLAQNRGKVIVTFLCDTGERYLSTELFN